jgi:choline dehydrogenase-like flavoprotein
MLIDAAELPDGSEITADLIIIGGGLAGITIAHEFLGAGRSVCVLEAGGRGSEPETQALYAGSASMMDPLGQARPMDEYLTTSRLRAYGGSGNLWGGKCAPLRSIDFERREWVPDSGWPFSREDLDSFYDRTCDLLEMPRFDFDISLPRDPGRPPLNIADDANLTTVPRLHTPVTGSVGGDAYDRFKDSILGAANVRVYLHANVVDITARPDGTRIDRVQVACLNGKRHTAKGSAYVLATGGIENVRLLLGSNGVHREGLGNGNGLVGRYFAGHVTLRMTRAGAGTAVFFSRGPESLDLYSSRDRARVWGVLATTGGAQREHELPNFTVTFFPLGREVRGPARAVIGAAALIDRGLSMLPAGDAHLRGRYLPVYFMSEQTPNPDSRVSLEAERDPLGQRRVNLAWVHSDGDYDGMERSIRFFGRELGRTGTGRLEWSGRPVDFLSRFNTSRHHMGTTRMSASPRQGVVDPDCRVHGISNLFIAGSSVFPTGGIANPTLTILALAMRLSDLLKRELGG